MKTYFFIQLALFTIAFTSCNLTNESNYSPELYAWASHINKTDTINQYLTDEGGVRRTDTINVGDTLVFIMYLNGVTNNLKNFYLTQSDSTISKILLPVETSMDSIFSKSESNYSKGQFIFLPKITSVFFPVRYIALKPTITEYIQLTLESDVNSKSTAGDNSVSFKLKIPAIEKPNAIKK